PPGEGSKSLAVAEALYTWLAAQRAERGHAVVALGGGVCGDLAGFVAATYLRGLPLVQVPTTLLAQIDSSIGGKVAVDLPVGKNLVGAFYPAALTLVDTALLDTLPRAQLVADYAEVIKTAMIFDAAMFELIEGSVDRLAEPALLASLVERCVRWKAKLVYEDPLDRGARAVLNYGHTIAHALEAAAGYGAYRHGEAVAIGMAGAAALAVRLGRCAAELRQRQNALLVRSGLPVSYRDAAPRDVLDAMRLDKKVRDGAIRWVLPDRIGAATVGIDVAPDLVSAIVHELRA
ncbi:MAG: 3-dehydroquinate synthase, partial [Actinobacteria bacterium]|nr:3-dehydroquinate synthase [Actinomycetota bacterium]